MKKTICKHCEETKEVYPDSGLCEECESDLTYCQICKEWEDTSFGGGCRHLQWSDHFGMPCGSGSDEGEDMAKDQLFPLLDCMGEEFAGKLLAAIKADDFYFRFHGSMMGPINVEINLRKEWSYRGFGINEKIEQAMEKDEEKGRLAEEGVCWLISLWAKKEDKNFYTGVANKKTVEIIKEWQVKRNGNIKTSTERR